MSEYTVGIVLASMAFANGVRDPLALAWTVTAAAYVYTADRYIDGKPEVVKNNTPESIAILAIVSSVILYRSHLEYAALAELSCVQAYPALKKRAPLLKSAFVGACWGHAVNYIPKRIENYDAVPDIETTLGFTLISAAVSNHADIADAEDDARDGIYTVPARFGRRAAFAVSTLYAGGGIALLSRKHRIMPQFHRIVSSKIA